MTTPNLSPDPSQGQYSTTLGSYADELSKAVYSNHAAWEQWAAKIGGNLMRELTEKYGLTDTDAERQVGLLRRALRDADRAMIEAGQKLHLVGLSAQVLTDSVNRALKRADRQPVGGVPLWRSM